MSPYEISCPNCGKLMIPIWFEEDEIKIEYGYSYRTGRTRTACSHLECPYCGQRECVDDSFDKPWCN